MTYETIIYEPGLVTRIILNRPEYRNAQSDLMLEELDDAFEHYANNRDAHVAVLSGNGSSFSAVHDIGSPQQVADRQQRRLFADRQGRYENSKRLFLDYTLNWRNVPKPTIAMVHGYCIFGGWLVASAMDIIFAAHDALFLPSHFQYFSVPWDLGARKTMEILYESRFVTGAEAYKLGFINRVYPKDDLERETLAYAAKVAENNPMSTRMVKFSVLDMLDTMGFTTHVRTAFHTPSSGAGPDDNSAAAQLPWQGALVEGKRRLTGVDVAFRRLQKGGPHIPPAMLP